MDRVNLGFHRIHCRCAGFCFGLFVFSLSTIFSAAATPQPAPVADPIQQFAPGSHGGKTGLLVHLQEIVRPEMRVALAGITEIYNDDLNWRLNGKAPPKPWNMPKETFRRESPPRSLNR